MLSGSAIDKFWAEVTTFSTNPAIDPEKYEKLTIQHKPPKQR